MRRRFQIPHSENRQVQFCPSRPEPEAAEEAGEKPEVSWPPQTRPAEMFDSLCEKPFALPSIVDTGNLECSVNEQNIRLYKPAVTVMIITSQSLNRINIRVSVWQKLFRFDKSFGKGKKPLLFQQDKDQKQLENKWSSSCTYEHF